MMLAVCELTIVYLVWRFYFLDPAIPNAIFRGTVGSPALVVSLLAVGIMAVSGLYHNKAFLDLRVMTIQIAFTCVILGLVCYFFQLIFGQADRPQMFLSVGEKVVLPWVVCIIATRVAFLKLADLDVFKKRLLVLGVGQKAARLAELTSGQGNRHFILQSFLTCGSENKAVSGPVVEICAGSPDDLLNYARGAGATEIIVATDDRRGLPIRELLCCRAGGIRVTDYLDFIERQTKTVDLGFLQPGWLVFSDGFRCSAAADACKRTLDVVLSIALLLFTLPLMLLTAVAIVLDSPGPVLYRQERAGLGGRPFVLLKFRSMRIDAEKDGAPRWALTGDPRVTRVGALIRKLRIDELPQLINVLRGNMSFVGPRPERPCFVNDFTQQIPFYAERHCVKPGITGWAQINYPYGASLEDAGNKLAYDLYYVKNHGLFLDLVIVLQTVRVILWADGAR
jgi:sugar transferase (PEP-CTERM system associated)